MELLLSRQSFRLMPLGRGVPDLEDVMTVLMRYGSHEVRYAGHMYRRVVHIWTNLRFQQVPEALSIGPC